MTLDGPRHKKTSLRGFRQSEIQTRLLSYRDYLEKWNLTRSKFTYEIFQKANNKGADQTVRDAPAGLSLCCLPPPKDRFSREEAQIIYLFQIPTSLHRLPNWSYSWSFLLLSRQSLDPGLSSQAQQFSSHYAFVRRTYESRSSCNNKRYHFKRNNLRYTFKGRQF